MPPTESLVRLPAASALPFLSLVRLTASDPLAVGHVRVLPDTTRLSSTELPAVLQLPNAVRRHSAWEIKRKWGSLSTYRGRKLAGNLNHVADLVGISSRR